MEIRLKSALRAGGFVAGMLFASTASAVTYGFQNISGNNATNAAAGQSQLFVDVLAAGSGVEFKFTNVGPAASSIADFYWDDRDSVLLAMTSITNGPGVSVSQFASPSNLPSGNPVNFSVNPAGASADSDAPAQPNGVNPGEMVSIFFSLMGTATYADVLTAIGNGSSTPDGLRIGIHVQGFANGGSESFVNRPTCVPGTPGCGGGGVGGQIPVPASLPLLLSALGAGILIRRRTRKTA